MLYRLPVPGLGWQGFDPGMAAMRPGQTDRILPGRGQHRRNGATRRIRTGDLLITSELLYQLS